MGIGAFTRYIDLAQVVLYAFWIFFAGLIYYLRREDKREGYPLESERSGRIRVQGFPAVPPPKTFTLADGTTRQVPAASAAPAATPARGRDDPIPLPTGVNALLAGVGPGSYTERADEPDLTLEGEPKIVPLSVAGGFSIAPRDPDPRGMAVIGADGGHAGVVKDVWIDRAEPQIRYYELTLPDRSGNVLLPAGFARIDPRGTQSRIRVRALLANQFAQVPTTSHPEQITLREEDRICAYYAAGTLYAEASRAEPIL